MTCAQKTLVESPAWSAAVPVEDWIEDSAYAILSGKNVVLVRHSWEDAVKGPELVLTGSGLAYEGDTTITKEWLADRVMKGRWELTQSWKACERHLVEAKSD